MIKRYLGILTCIVVTGCTTQANDKQQPKLNLDSSSVTVSGLSSGGYMAHQYHIAYSDQVSGAAMLASGPYGCAEGGLTTALENCINKTQKPDVGKLLKALKSSAAKQQLASIDNLKNDKVWIYHGTEDQRVSAEITDSVKDLYRDLGVKAKMQFTIASGHGFPTEKKGVQCDKTAEPHVNSCAFDAAGELLNHLYDDLVVKTNIKGKIIQFNQQQFVDQGEENTLADTGYLFAPEQCLQGKKCRIHIAFHGCSQNEEKVGKAFVEMTGYNTWAEANRLVVIYPQTKASYQPLNPNACWDWWGYTGTEYQYRSGKQMKHINNMVLGL